MKSSFSRRSLRRSNSSMRRRGKPTRVAPYLIEGLENRLLLSQTLIPILADTSKPVIELAPDTIDPKTGISPPSRVADPANIIWTNRGASDGFDAVFGTFAATARGVVDQVIVRYEQMIGSFDYPSAGQTYSLTLSMAAGGGFGASASLATNLGGKPKSGSISMLRGSNPTLTNTDHGWFLDPTPADDSEFNGNIVNAFCADAPSGSPAFNKGDFYAVVASEMTHCMGLFGSALAGWSSHTTNTGIHDGITGVGNFWVFQGPSIQHLGTSDNAGSSDFGAFIHSGEGSGSNINFNGTNWIGAEDQGNAFFEFSRRYQVNNAFALMFKDAYGYLSVNPARNGTFYSNLNQTTHQVSVRGGAGTSADNIQIFRSAGNTLTVAVDVGDDIAGTGALPGAGALPAFVSIYDMSQVSSISVDTGSGNDVIFLDTTNFSANLTQSISINAGPGDDSLTTTFFGQNLDFLQGAISFDGGTGTDDITLFDNGATFSDTYSLTNSTLTRNFFGGLTYSNSESLFLNAESGNNVFNIAGTFPGMSYTLDGRDGNDTFNVGTVGGNAEGIDGALSVIGNNGTDAVSYNDLTAAGDPGYTLTATQLIRSFNGTLTYATTESMRIDAGAGNNSILLNDLVDARDLVVNGNGGNDSIQVELNVLRFAATPPIAVDGGAGTDLVTINTTLSATGTFGVPTVTNNAFTTPTARTVNYSTFEGLTCNVLYVEDRSFFILSTAASTPVTINGGTKRDLFQVGGLPGFVGTVTLNNILGTVTLNGNGDNDTVSLNDQDTAFNQLYSLTATTFSRTGIAAINYASSEAVNINAGGGADTINVLDHPAGAVVTVDGRGGLDDIKVNSDGIGIASVIFPTTQDLVSLDILAGGTATLAAGGDKVIDTDGLTVAATGKLDLNDNDLIVDYTGATPIAVMQALVRSARNGGTWTGNGITSTTARNNAQHNTTLGAMEAADFKGIYGNAALFAGRTIDTTAVLVKYTYYGDADFSGKVNFDDYVRTDSGFNNHRTGWVNGDFDLNGSVNFDDYVLIDLAFNTQGGVL